MKILKRFKGQDLVADEDNKDVWNKLDKLEKGQQALDVRLRRVELQSGIYKR